MTSVTGPSSVGVGSTGSASTGRAGAMMRAIACPDEQAPVQSGAGTPRDVTRGGGAAQGAAEPPRTRGGDVGWRGAPGLEHDRSPGSPEEHISAHRLARILAAASARDGLLTPLERLLRACVDLLDLEGAAAILMTDEGGGIVLARDGEDGTPLLERQFELGVGPALDAHRRGDVVMTPDLGRHDDARWPDLAAWNEAVRAVLAAPMRLGGVRLGVLVLHRARPGRWSVEEQLDAMTVADLSTNAALDHLSGLEDGDLAPTPQNAVIHQATGMLAARHDSDLLTALARLRALAFAEGRPLYDVAVDVVTGGRT